MNVLITGGAGFVGSNLARSFKQEYPSANVVVFDNLRRRGSELNLPSFREQGITFTHGDIRIASDLDEVSGNFDIFIEASAEPSVLAGLNGSPQYLLQTNLSGTLNCLEFARKRAGCFIFLSSSRVYSVQSLREVNLQETPSRYELSSEQVLNGVTQKGITEKFPTHLPRSLYGATKLASELVVQEYTELYELPTIINRCGVIAGAGQYGRVDQGVFTLWVAHHFFRKPLRYTGFGGTGKQVRDLLHPSDLYQLLKQQLSKLDSCAGEVFNVGGGSNVTISLHELTQMCSEVSGNSVSVTAEPQTNAVDIPLYISDCGKAAARFDWHPRYKVQTIIQEIYEWLRVNEGGLRPIFT